MTHRQVAHAHARRKAVVAAAASRLRRLKAAGPRIRLQHPGLLKAYGYVHVAGMPAGARRAALARAAANHGWTYLVRRLNVLFVFNKWRHPALAAIFRADRDFASTQLAKARA
jgi:hypothetical protein